MYYLYGVFICLSCVKLVDLVDTAPVINPSVEELYISTMKSKTEFLRPIKRCEIVEASPLGPSSYDQKALQIAY